MQVYVFGHLHDRDGDKNRGQRIHLEQIHVPSKPLELAGLRGDCVGLCHPYHRAGQVQRGIGQPGWPSDVQGVASAENGVHYARWVFSEGVWQYTKGV